MKIGSENLLQK